MLKRASDIAVSLAVLLVLSPLLIGVAVAIRLTSPGPILHRATRVGRGGRLFMLYKFRSMVADAEKVGPGITAADDARITPIGRILRRTKLDEFPQLINVLRGEMSLVGPRPEDPAFVALYTPEQREVLSVRPGLTSLASVRFRNEQALLLGPDWKAKYVDEIMPAKLALDLAYVKDQSFATDLKILLQTFFALWQ